MSHQRLAALAFSAMLVFAGCGGSSASKTSKGESASMTSGQFIAKADTICARFKNKVAPLHNTNLAIVAPQLVAVERGALLELNKLTPPSSMAEDWKQILADQQQITEDTTKLGEYGKANNVSAERTLFYTGEKIQQQMTATAAQDGLKNCADIA